MVRLYQNIELLLILIITIQTVWNLSKSTKFFQEQIGVIFYIIVLLSNRIAYGTFNKSETLYYFFHAFAPLGIILGLWLKEKIKIAWIVLLWVLGSLLLWYISNYFAYFTVYCIAISALIREAIKSANSRSKVLKHSYLPIAIAIDLFFAFTAVVLNVKGLNWANSQFIGYLKYLIMPFSLLTLILIYVKFRRYTVD
ncbi:hypothetical protein N9Y33_05585 [Bacteroidia bacterium]|nr:hypothetical protein [Bacteroidia bacterium]